MMLIQNYAAFRPKHTLYSRSAAHNLRCHGYKPLHGFEVEVVGGKMERSLDAIKPLIELYGNEMDYIYHRVRDAWGLPYIDLYGKSSPPDDTIQEG